MVLGPRGWIAVGAWLSLILVPFFHYYWKRWDRPSKAAQEEMNRRKREFEVKRAFELEDMKVRAEEAARAKMEIEQRKRIVPKSVDSALLEDAWNNLGIKSKQEEYVQVTDEINIPKIKEMLESLPEVDEEFIIPDTGPVMLKIRPNIQIDEEPEQIEDKIESAPDLESWKETDW